MARVLRRTPREGKVDPKQGPGRKPNPKHTEIHMKEIRYILTGSSREALNSVASTMHKAATGHEFVKGGKTKRPVTIQHESTNPKKIFDGIILPNNPA